MSKYENYYPIETCFEDKETSLLKKDSMCEYCYSCYLELCDSFSYIHQTEEIHGIKDTLRLKHITENLILEKEKYNFGLGGTVYYIVKNLNKYTNYSNFKKEGCNLLHITFIECVISTLFPLLEKYYLNKEEEFNYKYTDKNLKLLELYSLNIICLEVYFYQQSYSDVLIRSMGRLYQLVKDTVSRK